MFENVLSVTKLSYANLRIRLHDLGSITFCITCVKVAQSYSISNITRTTTLVIFQNSHVRQISFILHSEGVTKD